MQWLHKILSLAIICAAARAQECPPACACNSTRMACAAAAAPQHRLSRAYLSSYAQLQELSWINSKLNALEIHVFDGLNDLEYIDMSRNEIKRTEHGLFSGLHQLKSLNLSRNFIDDIPRYTFADLDNLEVLDVSHNRLLVIPFQVFAPMIKL